MKTALKNTVGIGLGILLFSLFNYKRLRCISCHVAKDKMRGVKYVTDPCTKCAVRGWSEPPPDK